jgi:hypothetical protein
MKIERFEDIKAWQEARELVRLVYKAINNNKVFGKAAFHKFFSEKSISINPNTVNKILMEACYAHNR